MKILKIGIDIDNVIADSTPSYIAKFNEVFGTSISISEVTDFYHIERNTKIQFEQSAEFIDQHIHKDEFQLSIPAYDKPKEVIKKWAEKGYKLIYVTARPHTIEKATYGWLRKHGFLYPGTKVYLHNIGVHSTDILFKKTIARENEIDLFIEDKKDIAQSLTIPVLLLDKPWNQGRLPRHIKRVYSWDKIDEFVEKFKKV